LDLLHEVHAHQIVAFDFILHGATAHITFGFPVTNMIQICQTQRRDGPMRKFSSAARSGDA